jgi:hypothetical protein
MLLISVELPRIPADPTLTGIAVGVLVAGLIAWLIVTRRPTR